MSDDVAVTITSGDSVSLAITEGGGGVVFAEPEVLATNGSTTSFTFNSTFKANSLQVFTNGVLTKKETTYTEKANRSGIDFVVAPASDDEIEVRYAVG